MLAVREQAARRYRARSAARLPVPAVVRRGEAGYPEQLEDEDPPRQLWCLGDAALLASTPIVAIVGTRNCTAYGERIARGLARAVAAAGGCVVSGMARGVDAAAHRGAIDAGGHTIAVLGTGVDVPYPASHRALHAEIATKGLVVSEMPMGRTAFKGCFPRRNRIIAGLGAVTVVVEGGFESGALGTATIAERLGREVACVPGEIDNPVASGSNLRIRDGAHILTSIDDLLSLAGLTPAVRRRYEPQGEEERLVCDALARSGATVDVVALRTGLPAARCFATITALELAGAVECTLGGVIRLR